MLQPAWQTRQRPGSQQRLLLRVAVLPSIETAPTPRLGTLHEIGPQSVPLHVATNREEVLVVLNGKRLEAALIHMTAARAVPMSVPAPRVRQRQPADEPGEFVVFPRPDDHVPMIGQNAISQQPRFRAIDGFLQNAFERVIVFRLVKDRPPGISPIQNVINQTASRYSIRPSHDNKLPKPRHLVKKRVLTPFLTRRMLTAPVWRRFAAGGYANYDRRSDQTRPL